MTTSRRQSLFDGATFEHDDMTFEVTFTADARLDRQF